MDGEADYRHGYVEFTVRSVCVVKDTLDLEQAKAELAALLKDRLAAVEVNITKLTFAPESVN